MIKEGSTMFILNTWYIAAWDYEVVGAAPLPRRICNQPVVLFRDSEGKVAALEDRCCHRGTPLHLGKVINTGIQCGYHGMAFDGAGKCVEIPGQDTIPRNARVRSYPVVEKDEFIWIWMGHAEKADPALIVDYPYHNGHRAWPHKRDVYHVKADYMLLVDNLMDLTHLGYIHTTTIGGNPKIHVAAEMKVTPRPDGLHFIRRMRDSVPPATYIKAVDFKGNVDRWQEFDYRAPASIVQWTGAKDVGTGAYEGNQDGGFSLRIFHGLTPETETSSFYFWSAANGYRQNEPEATEHLFREVSTAFNEDRAVIEEQQARLSETGEVGLINIRNDAARVHMRRIVQRMLEAEQASGGEPERATA
jgi:phenylpropionate dioxygenase-like ring-hydroxylating dioxygenase large terminal subunit